jgi:putative oxidoreductase
LFVFAHDGVTAFMSSLGQPFPAVNAVLITAVELGGGLALLAGAATRSAALLIAGAMTVATITVHLPNGFFLPNGVEFAMSMGLVALSLAMTGAGRYSVDALVARRRTTTSPPQSYRQAA